MKRIKLLSLFVILLVAITSSGQQLRHIRTGNYEGVVDLKPYYLDITNTRTKKYIPDNRIIAKIEKKLSGMITQLAEQYRVLNGLASAECNIKQKLKSYKRYYTGFCLNNKLFVNIEFYRKLPNDKYLYNQDQLLSRTCPGFILMYDCQNDNLEMISGDDQTIEIDKSPEPIKQEPNLEEQLK